MTRTGCRCRTRPYLNAFIVIGFFSSFLFPNSQLGGRRPDSDRYTALDDCRSGPSDRSPLGSRRKAVISVGIVGNREQTFPGHIGRSSITGTKAVGWEAPLALLIRQWPLRGAGSADYFRRGWAADPPADTATVLTAVDYLHSNVHSMMSLSLCLLLLLWDPAFRAHGFNLETRLPIVKRSLEVSYFGYSVAGHQSYDEIKLQVENSWLVYLPLLSALLLNFCLQI